MITGTQIRMARAAVGWSVEHLAELTGLGRATVQRMEQFAGYPNARRKNLDTVRAIFEKEGVQFVEQTETGGPGVRAPKTHL